MGTGPLLYIQHATLQNYKTCTGVQTSRQAAHDGLSRASRIHITSIFLPVTIPMYMYMYIYI